MTTIERWQPSPRDSWHSPCAHSRRRSAGRGSAPSVSSSPARRSQPAATHGATAQQAVRIAVETTGARAGALWRLRDERPELVASLGSVDAGLARAALLVAEAVEQRRPAGIAPDAGAGQVATLTLGAASVRGAPALLRRGRRPARKPTCRRSRRSRRAPHTPCARRSGSTSSSSSSNGRGRCSRWWPKPSRACRSRTRLETAVERIAELLQVEHVGVFLHEDGRLHAAAARGLRAANEDVAARLVEALRGPLRARGTLHANVEGREPALAAVRAALASAGRRAVIAVPLTAQEESIGLIVAYPGDRRLERERDVAHRSARRAARGRGPERAPARAGPRAGG